ncbi:MobF family relaxase [Lignipirellula cremea]|uniref:Multifunctional conjugation protein TraI n=1 Tax=Lignipirellula cremea TaxID=2528010 RepID=A0A518E3B9_9BACT|nr:MobF family relaxase [Lignipirellula cremea]QDU98589.1 Multifunctional conjugation protein TraI [Lignipirellula cremea]
MLIATQGKSVPGTRQYFEQVLTQGDYYLGQEVAGQWRGKGAEILSLGRGSKVTKEQFNALLQGNHPVTGKQLTQRNRKDRRPGMDLTFSVPKSVSLAWAINGDERIVAALQAAVRETMAHDVEPLMQRRVRQGKHAASKQKVQTGNIIYADFLHKTSRPVEGNADPHLHVHAFVINWTQQNGRHFAGEFEEIVRQRPSLQAKFEARLAGKLQHELGYQVEHVRFRQSGKLKHGWEILGVDRATIEKFSRRTAQVEEHANKKGIKDAERKGQLGKLTREKKETGKSIAQLRQEWRSRLSAKEQTALGSLTSTPVQRGQDAEREAAAASVKYALDHHLYRQSTVERHQVVGTALEHGLTLQPETVEKALNDAGVIQRAVDDEGSRRQLITTREVLGAEKQMIGFARDGRGTRKAIGTADHEISRTWLNEQQQAAVRFVLESRDSVMAVAGGAGTGKSSLMQEAAEAIRHSGKELFTFAPSTGAREVLEEKGFKNAQTVEYLLRNSELQAKVKDQVVWIDEAGLLDVRSMNAVFKIAMDQNARIVLSGDTRQHASPRRGEAMRLLETEAGLSVARVEAIQRQKGRYRQAVELISRGNEVVDARSGKTGLTAGFDMLDAMGKVKEIAAEDRYLQLAESYLTNEAKGRSTLIVAPTHAEAAQATAEIRERLQRDGKLSTDEQTFTQFRSLNLSQAEKGEAATYADQKGVIVQFHQNVKGGFKRGDRYRVQDASNGTVRLESMNGQPGKTLPLQHADRFEVYAENELRLAAGDKLRFSLGGVAQHGQRLSNGRLDEVKGFDKQGNIVLKNGWVVDRDFAHLDLGYVITSHASQGKDRDLAIAAMGSESLPAINAKQFYVTVSRGRDDVVIFVDNKAKVRRAIERSGGQLSATALLRSSAPEEKRETRSATTERFADQGRRLFASFRDRVVHWWRGQREATQSSRETSRGRPGENFGPGWGMGMSPAPGKGG